MTSEPFDNGGWMRDGGVQTTPPPVPDAHARDAVAHAAAVESAADFIGANSVSLANALYSAAQRLRDYADGKVEAWRPTLSPSWFEPSHYGSIQLATSRCARCHAGIYVEKVDIANQELAVCGKCEDEVQDEIGASE